MVFLFFKAEARKVAFASGSMLTCPAVAVTVSGSLSPCTGSWLAGSHRHLCKFLRSWGWVFACQRDLHVQCICGPANCQLRLSCHRFAAAGNHASWRAAATDAERYAGGSCDLSRRCRCSMAGWRCVGAGTCCALVWKGQYRGMQLSLSCGDACVLKLVLARRRMCSFVRLLRLWRAGLASQPATRPFVDFSLAVKPAILGGSKYQWWTGRAGQHQHRV
jgi:hypothetical protein